MSSSTVPSRFHHVDAVRAQYGDSTVDRILQSVTLSDEPADRLVEAFGRLPGGAGWPMLGRAMALGPQAVDGAPPELSALLAPVLAPPAWVDFDLVDAGAVAWWRAGALPQLLVLAAASLAYGYGSAGFARPLLRTGRLVQMAPRRLEETARWVQAATRPGALRPGRAGLEATVRLRMVHALVRAHLRRQGDWDVFNWGVPLSVGETLATGIGGFFLVPERALADLGVHYSRAEREALTHLWSWISFVMGVPEEHLPSSYGEALTWIEAAEALDSGVIAESTELVHALLFHGFDFERILPGPAAALTGHAAGHLLGACARRWMGKQRADDLQVPDTPLKHLVPIVRPAVHARDALRATGLFGSDERLAGLEIARVDRALTAFHAAKAQLGPEHIERQPVLDAPPSARSAGDTVTTAGGRRRRPRSPRRAYRRLSAGRGDRGDLRGTGPETANGTLGSLAPTSGKS